jgi:hypothetical protein
MKYNVLATLVYQDNGLLGLDAVKFSKCVSTLRTNMFLKTKTTCLSEGLVSIRYVDTGHHTSNDNNTLTAL